MALLQGRGGPDDGASAGGGAGVPVRLTQSSGLSVGLGVGPAVRRRPALRFAARLSTGDVEGSGAPAVLGAAGLAAASLFRTSRSGCGSPSASGDFTAGLDVSLG
jgi:hypothetical protein